MSEDLRAETLMIKSAGGAEIQAYQAVPLAESPVGGVVVIHHLPGYDWSTKEIVRRLAANSYIAIMPNLHWHDAPGALPDDAAAASRAAGGVPDDRLVEDVAGTIDHITSLPIHNGKVGVIGHCSGGRQAFLAGCRLDVDAVVDCYGAFIVGSPPPQLGLNMGPLIDLTPSLSAPLLGLFGKEDANPNPEHVAALAAELDRYGKPFEFHSFDNAGHAFFSVDRPNYRVEAANQGWGVIFDYFEKQLST
jgi:carboxymethylenebutenolidase